MCPYAKRNICPIIVALVSLCAFIPVSGMRPAALVTGSTDGIGLTTAKHLAAKGYAVFLHGRNEARIENAKKSILQFVRERKSEEAQVYCLPASDLSSVAGCELTAKNVLEICHDKSNNIRLEVLMNNAGVYSKNCVITPDKTELTFAVNVVAPFVITSLLLPHLVQDQEGHAKATRIVVASSISQCSRIRDWNDMAYKKRSYSAHGSYSESKLLDAMLTVEVSRRLEEAGLAPDRITCNCLDPGTVNTKMLLAGWGPIGIDVEDALDETWLCTSDEVNGLTGKYFVYQHERSAARSAYDPSERKQLWSTLCRLAPEAALIWNFSWLSKAP